MISITVPVYWQVYCIDYVQKNQRAVRQMIYVFNVLVAIYIYKYQSLIVFLSKKLRLVKPAL
jgi:hypothetical protein